MTTKVADFGMSRDVYMSDYYKLGHHIALPVKWLAPEALFKKKFDTKTDVVSKMHNIGEFSKEFPGHSYIPWP